MRAQNYIQMKMFSEYEVSFFGLNEGIHYFEYNVEKSFFEEFNYEEILDTDLLVKLKFIKKNTLFELVFSANGTVKILCDLSNEPYNQQLDASLNFVIKFGEKFNDDNDEILILPYGEHQINVAQYIYEMIILSVPNKKVHPGISAGTLKSDILQKLEELKPKEKKNLNEIDPRWEDLKKLLIDKNK